MLRAVRLSTRWISLVLLLAACSGRSATGALTPPSDARPWQTDLAPAFDAGFTRAPVQLEGRAPNDVLDQRLFAQRFGLADVVALVTVEQVFARGRHRARPRVYAEVEIEELLIGELLQGTAMQQVLPLRLRDEIPEDLQGEPMVLFLRWAPGKEPPYRHHLMPADPRALAFMRAMIDHAKEQGVLDARGVVRKGKRGPDEPLGE